MDAGEQAKRKRRAAALKAAETKGPEERSRTAKMAIYTMRHGKNDAQNPYSKENYYAGENVKQGVRRMPRITLTLAVTAATVRYVNSGHPNERQIAIQTASDGLLTMIHRASRQ